MLAVKGRFNGATVVLDSIPNSKELGAPIKECEVIVNFPDVFKSEDKQENSLKQILKYRGQGIWEGDIEDMRSPR
ncbi:MAG: hypothetical protein LBV17_09285 [Treponema sp.]|jgi:hypothetical protein|nr:hypothetical protein [Treponema sp.]